MRLGTFRFLWSLLWWIGIGPGVFSHNILATTVNQHALVQVHVQIQRNDATTDSLPVWSVSIDEVPLDSSVSPTSSNQEKQTATLPSSDSPLEHHEPPLSGKPSSPIIQSMASVSDVIHRQQRLSLEWTTKESTTTDSNVTIGETAVSFLFSMLPPAAEVTHHHSPNHRTISRPRTTRTLVVALWEEEHPQREETPLNNHESSSSPAWTPRRRLLTRQLAHIPRSVSDADQFVSPYTHVHLQATCRSCSSFNTNENKHHSSNEQHQQNERPATAVVQFFLVLFQDTIQSWSSIPLIRMVMNALPPWMAVLLPSGVVIVGLILLYQLLCYTWMDDDDDDLESHYSFLEQEDEDDLLLNAQDQDTEAHVADHQSASSSSSHDSTYEEPPEEEHESSSSSIFDENDYEEESRLPSPVKEAAAVPAAAPPNQDPDDWWGDETDEHDQPAASTTMNHPQQQPRMVFENTGFVDSWAERRHSPRSHHDGHDSDSSLELPPPMERHVVRPSPEENITFESEIERFEQLNLSSPLSSRRSAASGPAVHPPTINPVSSPSRLFGSSSPAQRHQALAWDRPMLFQSPTPAARRRQSFSQSTNTGPRNNGATNVSDCLQTKKRKLPEHVVHQMPDNKMASASKKPCGEDSVTAPTKVGDTAASAQNKQHVDETFVPAKSDSKSPSTNAPETNLLPTNQAEKKDPLDSIPDTRLNGKGPLPSKDGEGTKPPSQELGSSFLFEEEKKEDDHVHPPMFEEEEKKEDDNVLAKDLSTIGEARNDKVNEQETMPIQELPTEQAGEVSTDNHGALESEQVITTGNDVTGEESPMDQHETCNAKVDSDDSLAAKPCSSVETGETAEKEGKDPSSSNTDKATTEETVDEAVTLERGQCSALKNLETGQQRSKSNIVTPDIATEVINSTRADTCFTTSGISAPPLSRELSNSYDQEMRQCPADEGKSELPKADSSVAPSVQSQAARRLEYEPRTRVASRGEKRNRSSLESAEDLELGNESTKRTPLTKDAPETIDIGAPRKQSKPHASTETPQCPVSAAKSDGSNFTYVSTLPPDTEQSSSFGSIGPQRSERDAKEPERKMPADKSPEAVAYENTSTNGETLSIPDDDDDDEDDCDFSVKIIHCRNGMGPPRKRHCGDILPEVVPSISLVNLNQTIEASTWSFESSASKSPSKAVIGSKQSASSKRSNRNQMKSIGFEKANKTTANGKRTRSRGPRKMTMTSEPGPKQNDKRMDKSSVLEGTQMLESSIIIKSQSTKQNSRTFSRRSRNATEHRSKLSSSLGMMSDSIE